MVKTDIGITPQAIIAVGVPITSANGSINGGTRAVSRYDTDTHHIRHTLALVTVVADQPLGALKTCDPATVFWVIRPCVIGPCAGIRTRFATISSNGAGIYRGAACIDWSAA